MWLIYLAYDMEKHIVPEDFKQMIQIKWKVIKRQQLWELIAMLPGTIQLKKCRLWWPATKDVLILIFYQPFMRTGIWSKESAIVELMAEELEE